MTTLLPATLAFSVIASLAVLLAGRRDAIGADRLSAAALAILLGVPPLTLLPGWALLPIVASTGSDFTFALLAWLPPAGTVLFLIRLLLSSCGLRRWIRSSRLIGHSLSPDGRRIEILSTPRLASPCAAGVLRPVILVPAHWASLPHARRQMILAHEIAHHQRRDPLWRLLGALACALHWFNPLVWWLARRHAYQSELACDAAVLAAGTPAAGYAHLLCDLAQARPGPLAAAMAGSMLGKRIECIQSPTRRLSALASGLILLPLLLAGVACGLRRPASPIPAGEIQLRLTADPFPGES